MTTTIDAAELLGLGLCAAQCLLGQEDKCVCRCRGRWHGALARAQVAIPADLTLAEALSGGMTLPRQPKRQSWQIDPLGHYAAQLDRGEIPSVRRIRRDLHVGQDRAKVIQAGLTEALNAAVAA